MVQLEEVRIFNATHPLTSFEIQKYYQNKPKFNGVYSITNLPKIKDGAYVVILHGYKWIGTQCIALHVNQNNATYLDSFVVESVPKEIKKIHIKQKYNNNDL